MKTFRLSLALGAALAATAAFAQFGLDLGKVTKAIDTAKDGAKVLKGTVGIGPQEERKIGEATAVEIIGKFGGLVRDEDVMRRVNLVGRAMARYSDRPSVRWQFAVLNSDTVNAFSAPGGLVFITRGLYDQATTDDLLAAILGHEIAHITNKNALKIVQRGEVTSGALGVLKKRSSDVRQASAVTDQVGSVLGFDVLGLTGKLFTTGFDAATEYTADKDGRELAITTGFAPGGMRAVLLDLQTHGENRKTMFASHPPVADRLKHLPNDPAPPAAGSAATETAPTVAASDAKDQPGGETK
jgi:predicted Zn-dependent protease